jgi:hypothetical protein
MQNNQNPKNIDKDTLKIISQNIVNFYKDYFGEENADLKSWNIVEQSDIDSLNMS